MNEPVDRLIAERAALDRGFSRGVLLSIAAHLLLVGAAVASAVLMPKKPALNVANVFAVQIPRGGGGSPDAPADPAPAPPKKPEPSKPEAPKPTAPKKEIIKPPKPEERKGLPMPDAKKAKATPTKAPASGGGGTGKATEVQGVGIGAFMGPGLPEGVDMAGDMYMAGVVMKVARIWRSQIRQEIKTPVVVRFTILADGSVTDVQVMQSSGVYLLDSAARSAVATAAPFTPLPKHYDNQYCNASSCTLQVRFTY